MAAFPYSDHQILHFVKMRKTIAGDKFAFKPALDTGDTSEVLRETLSADEMGAANMELRITAVTLDKPELYHAILLLNKVRIRGVDYDPIGRKRGFKKNDIPVGWHQNIEYPGHQTDRRHEDANSHMGIVVDLEDFSRKVCALWNIELEGQKQKTLL